MDKRKKYGLIIDTETANTLQEGNKLDMRFVLPYDIGFAVIDTRGNIYEKGSYLIKEIFCDERELMKTCYYAKKIPMYLEDIKNGSRIIKNAYEIRQIILETIKKYNCGFVVAYNMRFDLTALNNLIRWTTKSKYRYFFPFGLEIWDCMKMAGSTLVKQKSYRLFCEKNNYITSTGQLRKTVEILYKYLSGNDEFKESHTGLEDVEIEAQIFHFCDRQHKTMNPVLFDSKKREKNFQMENRKRYCKWWESVL